LYLSVNFFFILYIFKKTFKLDEYKPIIFSMFILVFSLSLLPQNLMESIKLEINLFRNYSWIISFGLTMFTVFCAWIYKNMHGRIMKNES
jgi:hypothetical protein